MELVRDISEELKSSYIDYAMSVIVGRALPDVRDGLKPVQRRILWTMFEMGLRHDRPYRKCARIVGETLGKYHPHGDQPVYEALVRMAQDFVMRYPLVDGQGNFGSIDGDEPAAMRYTEARLTKIAEELLADIDKNTVDFVPNFDATLKEPAVLPAKVPNLLINGSTGIAVGMATNIPPHNLKEVCMAIIAYIKNPNITVKELMKYIKGPDFPTGGIIVGRKGIEKAYETGKGRITIRGKVEIEKNAIVIRELPYMVNKARLVEKIADLIKEGKIEARTVRDESDREGIRVVVELKSGADVNAVLEKLYDHTPLQTTFSIINLALVDGEPKILNLKEMIACYVEHRREVIRRRIKYELDKAKERLHIVEGLKIAVENLDDVISIIKTSKSPENAKKILIERYKLSEKQASAILQMRLQKLTSTEVSALIKEYNELKAKIAEFEEILKNPAKVDEIIIKELEELINNYSDRRRTKIIDEEEKEKEKEEEIKKERKVEVVEENIVIITNGFIRRLDKIRKGKVDIAVKCNTLQKLLVFTNRKAYWLSVDEIPKERVNIKELLDISNNEKVVAVLPVDDFTEHTYVAILTQDGYIKKTSLSEFINARKKGVIASSSTIALARLFRDGEVAIATENGYVVRFKADEVPTYGRNARGVKAINLRKGDNITWFTIGKGEEFLILTKDGYGKRTDVSEFRLTNRGAMGVMGGGSIAVIEFIKGDEEVVIFTEGGEVNKVSVDELPKRERYDKGKKVCDGKVAYAILI